jgi:hypothetical protein
MTLLTWLAVAAALGVAALLVVLLCRGALYRALLTAELMVRLLVDARVAVGGASEEVFAMNLKKYRAHCESSMTDDCVAALRSRWEALVGPQALRERQAAAQARLADVHGRLLASPTRALQRDYFAVRLELRTYQSLPAAQARLRAEFERLLAHPDAWAVDLTVEGNLVINTESFQLDGKSQLVGPFRVEVNLTHPVAQIFVYGGCAGARPHPTGQYGDAGHLESGYYCFGNVSAFIATLLRQYKVVEAFGVMCEAFRSPRFIRDRR